MTDVSTDPETAANQKVAFGRQYWMLWAASVPSHIGDGVAMIPYPLLASAIKIAPVNNRKNPGVLTETGASYEQIPEMTQCRAGNPGPQYRCIRH